MQRSLAALCVMTSVIGGASCRSDNPAAPAGFTIEKAPMGSGDLQHDTVLATLAPLRALVRSPAGVASGVSVDWTLTQDADVRKMTSTTDADGIATQPVTLGPKATTLVAQASIAGGGSVTFTISVSPGNPARLRVVSGANQTDTVGAEVSYVVQTTDDHGNGVGDITVDWRVTLGDGDVDQDRFTTDASTGIVSAKHLLGPSLGIQAVTATAPAYGASVTIQSTATPGHAAALQIASGNNQAAVLNAPLPADYVVRVTDKTGHAIGGASVGWAIVSGDGVLSAAQSTSGPDGSAAIRASFGATPVQEVLATLSVSNGPQSRFTSVAGIKVRVTARTVGADLDADGYAATFTGPGIATGQRIDVPSNGVATTAVASPGMYAVTLDGLAANCDVVGPGSQSVAAVAGGGVDVLFDVTCSPARDLAIEVRVTNSTTDIYRVKSNGSGLTRLTTTGWGRHPAWSADGSRIAFQNLGISVMNADGSNQRRLSSTPSDDYPIWSPDGTKIAFARSESVFVANVDGSGELRLGTGGNPAFSPDGRKIAFTDFTLFGDSPLVVATVDGTARVQLTSHAFGPSWSPDGTRIAFETGNGVTSSVSVVNIDGSGLASVAQNAERPLWSPDGTRLLFTRRIGCGYQIPFCHYSLVVAGADGSGAVQVALDTRYENGTWSPDGRLVAYTYYYCPDFCYFLARLARSDGSGIVDVATRAQGIVAWRP